MFSSLDTRILYFLNGGLGDLPFFDTVVVFFAQYLPFIVPIAFLFILIRSSYTRKKKFFIAVSVFLSATISYLGGVNIIHFFYDRPRPFLTHDIENLFFEGSPAFPSGHSLFFFALAGAIYHFNKKWGVLFLLLALCIGVARIMAGVHYPTDVLAGAVIGFFVSYSIVRFTENYHVRRR